jgi:hypothetical protein
MELSATGVTDSRPWIDIGTFVAREPSECPGYWDKAPMVVAVLSGDAHQPYRRTYDQ